VLRLDARLAATESGAQSAFFKFLEDVLHRIPYRALLTVPIPGKIHNETVHL
jgi:hypothetical protein